MVGGLSGRAFGKGETIRVGDEGEGDVGAMKKGLNRRDVAMTRLILVDCSSSTTALLLKSICNPSLTLRGVLKIHGVELAKGLVAARAPEASALVESP